MVRRTKTWRHHPSKHPRADHAAMDGETVGLDERFSNGADYPGDWTHGPASNVNCNCTMDVSVRKGDGSYMLSSITDRASGYTGTVVEGYEEARLFDRDNNPIGDSFKGTESHVRITLPDGYSWNEIRSCHTHTADRTFSTHYIDENGYETGDVFTFCDGGMISTEVITDNFVYLLERTQDFNASEFLDAATNEEQRIRSEVQITFVVCSTRSMEYHLLPTISMT